MTTWCLSQAFIRQGVKAGGHRGALQEEAGGHGTPQETGTRTLNPQDVFGLIFPHVASGAASQTSSFLSISQRKLLFLFQNKLMEEKNTVLVQTNVGLEEELRKANAAKGQLETYKRQVPDRRPC